MFAVCIVVGVFLSIIGFYIKSELKEDIVDINLGSIIVFALISFVVGILILIERLWAVCLLFPYLIIQFYINKKYQGEMATKVTWCEFCIGTGIGITFILAAIGLFVYYIFNNKTK